MSSKDVFVVSLIFIFIGVWVSIGLGGAFLSCGILLLLCAAVNNDK